VTGPALRVVAIDETPLVRVGLRLVIEQQAGLHWLGATDSHTALRTGLPRLRPHVVLVDGAVDPDGCLVRDLIDGDSALTVVALLHDHQRSAASLRAIRLAGAHGLVRREAPPADLVRAIVAAHANRWFVDPGLAEPDNREREPVEPLLTPRQQQILGMIANGMTESAITEQLVVSQDTVRSHIKHLRRRLGARDRAHAIARAYCLGVLPMPTEAP
jgi:DNA-binding NarL/FixJ family response regulator